MTELTANDRSVSNLAAKQQPLEVSEVKNVNSVKEDQDLHKLQIPNVIDLPPAPPSVVECNFLTFFVPDFMTPEHDQYVHWHANGLCVIGLASSHVAFKDEGGVTAMDFNVRKSDWSGIKITGKRKKNAQHFESNTVLCKVIRRHFLYC